MVRIWWALGLSLALATPTHGQEKGMSQAQALPYLHAQRLVRLPDGRRLNLYCLGSGSPTVILDGGLGETALTWAKVQPAVGRITQTCSYDRAGLGFSDPGPFPRDANRIVEDLADMLSAAKIQGPYIVVAHSLTGQTMRLFVSRHRSQVAGIVLVDPALGHRREVIDQAPKPVADLLRRGDLSADHCMQTIASGASYDKKIAACGGAPPKMPGYPEALNQAVARMWLNPTFAASGLSEWESLNSVDAAEIEAGQKPFGDIPLVVLTATVHPETRTPEEREGLQDIMRSEHRTLSKLSSNGQDVVVAGADHSIQTSKPEVVIAVIRNMIDQGRQTRAHLRSKAIRGDQACAGVGLPSGLQSSGSDPSVAKLWQPRPESQLTVR